MNPSTEIDTLVLSGGGEKFITQFAIIKEAHDTGYLNISNIKTIHGTSAGTICAVLLASQIELSLLEKYILHVSFDEYIKYDLYTIIHIIEQCGFVDQRVMEHAFDSIFRSCDLTINVTLKEYYEYTGVDMHFYAYDITAMKHTDINHATHPNWRVVDAVYVSCSLPIIFKPHLCGGHYYVDGGIYANYPLIECKRENNEDRMFGINVKLKLDDTETKPFANLFEFLFTLITSVLRMIYKYSDCSMKNEIVLNLAVTVQGMYLAVTSKEERGRLMELGRQYFREYRKEEKEMKM